MPDPSGWNLKSAVPMLGSCRHKSGYASAGETILERNMTDVRTSTFRTYVTVREHVEYERGSGKPTATLKWPRMCACCLRGDASAFVWVKATSYRDGRSVWSTWKVPYCFNCQKHVALANHDPSFAASVSIATIGLVALAALFRVSLVWLAISSLPFFTCLAWIYLRAATRRATLATTYGAGCASKTTAVDYYQAIAESHSFSFANKSYAHAFEEANRENREYDGRAQIAAQFELPDGI